ncbi:MAG TPA: hypothetical protein VF910_08295 [Candidatus Bathyarchaeia archaeon]
MVRVMGRSWRDTPRFVRIVLVLQALVIAGLSAWIYNEYVNNQYLQTYLLSLFQGRGSVIAVIGFGGLLGTALIGILLKAGNILGEIEHLSEKVEDRTVVIPTRSGRSTLMPVLQMKQAEPVDEIGRLHRSLLRWSERSKGRE